MRKAFAIWLMAGLPVLADSVAATRSWVSNRVAEARAEWRGDVSAATNPVPSWISAAEGRVDARIAGATNGLPERIAAVTNGLPERIAAVTNGLPAKIAAVTNGLPERIAAVTNGLPEAIAASTNVVMAELNAATGTLWTAIGAAGGSVVDTGAFARTNDLPTKVSQLENDAGYLTNHVDVSNLARAAGLFPDWASKGAWSEGEFCTWKGVVYRFTGAGDPSAQPDISPVSWAVSDVGTAISGAQPDLSSLTNPVPSWIAASTNGLPEAIAAATNGLPAKIAGVTNGLPERIAAVTNGLPARIAAVTNGFPERIAAVTNGLPERIAAVTNGLPESIAAATNGLPEEIVASTNPVPSWIVASTSGIPAQIASSVRSLVAGLDSKTATRLASVDGLRFIDGTGAVWQVVSRAVWGERSADSPVGATSWGTGPGWSGWQDDWEFSWIPDDEGSSTGTWDLRYRIQLTECFAHYTVSGLPYREDTFSLTLPKVTVGSDLGAADDEGITPGYTNSEGWYQVNIGGYHYSVTPLTTSVSVIRATNHVDRLALSGELVTSNDVRSIVTETSEGGLTDWEVHGIPDGFSMELFGEETQVWGVTNVVTHNDVTILALTTDGEPLDSDVYCVVTNFSDDVTFLQFTNTTGIGAADAITATRGAKAVTNVLGFARLTDVTNIVTKHYVESLGIEAGISAATATGIVEAVVIDRAAPIVARVATNTLLTTVTETKDTWYCEELEGWPDTLYSLEFGSGRWYAAIFEMEDGGSFNIRTVSGAGAATDTSVTVNYYGTSTTFTKTGTATEEIPVYDFVARETYVGPTGQGLVNGQWLGGWFDVETNSWRFLVGDHTYASGGKTVRDYRLIDVADRTNVLAVATRVSVPEGTTVITNFISSWGVNQLNTVTSALVVVATPRSLNALGLARFSDLDRYAVPRQRLTEEVRRAVNLAADYLWDPLDEVCYRRQMSGGFLDYIAVTNIDVTLPENWQALEALEAERRSQQ